MYLESSRPRNYFSNIDVRRDNIWLLQASSSGFWLVASDHEVANSVGSNSKLGNGFCNIMMVWPRSRATLPSQLRRITSIRTADWNRILEGTPYRNLDESKFQCTQSSFASMNTVNIVYQTDTTAARR